MQSISKVLRIMIVGGLGSGKSTLAQLVSAKLNLPIIHRDNFFWASNWVQREKDHITQLVRSAAEGQCWIFDSRTSGKMQA